jgi:molybdate transport system substrate-binding protein
MRPTPLLCLARVLRAGLAARTGAFAVFWCAAFYWCAAFHAAAPAAAASVAERGAPAELTVSAAASLANAFREIATAFEQLGPGRRVLTNFAGSGALLQQIAHGAPVDVFAPADQETMDRAQVQGLIDAGLRHDFAANRLVVVVPIGPAAMPASLAALVDPVFARIAIGTPASVPAGRYARQALEKAGLWSQLAGRTIGTQSVRQALDYVARGEVDAGFVYATDAALIPDRVRLALTVPTEPVRYPIARVRTAAEPGLAQAFIDYVRSPQGQAILSRHGFAPP